VSTWALLTGLSRGYAQADEADLYRFRHQSLKSPL